jgi:hypothetical protein
MADNDTAEYSILAKTVNDNSTESNTDEGTALFVANFLSAEVTASSGGNHIEVTVSGDVSTGAVTSEYFWTLNAGEEMPATSASMLDSTTVYVGVGPNGTISNSDTVTVSHRPSGKILAFESESVVNNLP